MRFSDSNVQSFEHFWGRYNIKYKYTIYSAIPFISLGTFEHLQKIHCADKRFDVEKFTKTH